MKRFEIQVQHIKDNKEYREETEVSQEGSFFGQSEEKRLTCNITLRNQQYGTIVGRKSSIKWLTEKERNRNKDR